MPGNGNYRSGSFPQPSAIATKINKVTWVTRTDGPNVSLPFFPVVFAFRSIMEPPIGPIYHAIAYLIGLNISRTGVRVV